MKKLTTLLFTIVFIVSCGYKDKNECMLKEQQKQSNTVQSNIQVQENKQNQKNLERNMVVMKSALIHSWMEAPVYMHMLKSELNAEVHFPSNGFH
jgi:hypothetical protein